MYKKMSEGRRRAFLKALEACGNQTLAAERACVSRSWVGLERSRSPDFDAECRRLVAAARERLRGAEGNAPPEGWGHLDGVELVVRGTNGRRVQIARARAGQWTARSERRFLSVLAATGNAEAAYSAAGKSKGSAYGHRRRWAGFERQWRAAVEEACVRLELGLVHYAMNPFSTPELPEPAPVSLTPEQALHSLHMNKNRLLGLGRRPGGRGRPPTMEQVTGRVLRAVEAVERGRTLDPAQSERDRRQWAARRTG
ncbi:MAG: hypothetical protein ABWX67_16165 [Allosphingosinicella sp.]